MDPESLQIAANGEESSGWRIQEFVAGIPKEQVDDDKTVLVLTDTVIQTKLQPPEYYEEPDWDKLVKKFRNEWNKKAYPSLYQGKVLDESDV